MIKKISDFLVESVAIIVVNIYVVYIIGNSVVIWILDDIKFHRL